MLCRLLVFTFGLALLCSSAIAQKKKKTLPDAPKLVVGIVVDQMRYDYLYRYTAKYGTGGFKRLLEGGFNHRNHHYHYALTVTAAGHAAVYTGSIPAISGMVGNEWYSQKLGRTVYCVEDSTAKIVGGKNVKAGQMSPRNMFTSTITDQLRIHQNFNNKTVGIAIKDRGSILPAGHTGMAYWFDGKEGLWISSDYYMTDLPQWVKDYNARKRPSALINEGWNTLLPIEQYTESTTDDKPYEVKLVGKKTATFPYELAVSAGEPFSLIPLTPHGNTITKEMALAAIEHEKLGQGAGTDFLAVSFSTPDYVGHAFGPNSIEEEDTYLRLDKDLAEMLTYLDTKVGKDKYLVFLTADHGVADVVGFSKENRLPAGLFDGAKIKEISRKALKDAFGEGEFVRQEENYQMYLNHALLKEKKLSVEEVKNVIREVLLKEESIAEVINLTDLGNSSLNEYQLNLYKNLYNPNRCGDIAMILKPNWYGGRSTGTTHGTPYAYDTHVPFLLYGWQIPAGQTSVRTSIADIAPTLADWLNILEPNGCVGQSTRGK